MVNLNIHQLEKLNYRKQYKKLLRFLPFLNAAHDKSLQSPSHNKQDLMLLPSLSQKDKEDINFEFGAKFRVHSEHSL